MCQTVQEARAAYDAAQAATDFPEPPDTIIITDEALIAACQDREYFNWYEMSDGRDVAYLSAGGLALIVQELNDDTGAISIGDDLRKALWALITGAARDVVVFSRAYHESRPMKRLAAASLAWQAAEKAERDRRATSLPPELLQEAA